MTADAIVTKEIPMKKITSLMIGLSLILGTAAFAEDKKTDTTTAPPAKKEKKEKHKKEKTTTTHTTPPPAK
jgi:hypothetical protein